MSTSVRQLAARRVRTEGTPDEILRCPAHAGRRSGHSCYFVSVAATPVLPVPPNIALLRTQNKAAGIKSLYCASTIGYGFVLFEQGKKGLVSGDFNGAPRAKKNIGEILLYNVRYRSLFHLSRDSFSLSGVSLEGRRGGGGETSPACPTPQISPKLGALGIIHTYIVCIYIYIHTNYPP